MPKTISDVFDVPSKAAVEAMTLTELKVVGQNLTAQRDHIVKLYRQSTSRIQERIVEEVVKEQNNRRNADPVKYDALHQGVGTMKP